MTRHTDGPWECVVGYDGAMSTIHKAGDKGFLIAHVVCESKCSAQRMEDIANAELLTNSPALLEACEDAYTHLCIMCNALGELTNKSDVEILNKLERAIRSAGGRVIGANGKEEK